MGQGFYDPLVTPLLGVNPQYIPATVQKYICIRLFIAALLVKAF